MYDTEVGMKFGGQPLWHHVDCFANLRDELGYYETGTKLPGYQSLAKADQKTVEAALPAVTDVPSKKVKKEGLDEVDSKENAETEKEIKKQNKALFKLRDKLKDNLTKPNLISILEKNDQDIPEGIDAILDRVSDIMIFGALKPCPKCQGQLAFSNVGYKCTGNLSEWVACENVTREPERTKCVLPTSIQKAHDFLGKYKSSVGTRAIQYVPPSGKEYGAAGPSRHKKLEEGPRVKRDRPPLYCMEFVILGSTKKDKEDLKKAIGQMGGKVGTKIHERIAAIISNPHEVEKFGSRMQQAKDHGIQVVAEDFVDAIEKQKGGALEYIQAQSICDWGTDPTARLPTEEEMKSKSKSIFTKSVPSKVTLQLKGGIAVDPDSGLVDKAHVYQDGKDVYNTILGLTDIQKGKNSFYKLQLLEADKKKNQYWIFRAWGRIGTTIGGNKVDKFNSLAEAQDLFFELYNDKTGNIWQFRQNFNKKPGKMYPIDVDYGQDEDVKYLDTHSNIKSKLEPAVQDLIKMIFDVETMKKTMLEFELDMEKMPLGRLSRSQLSKAYQVLSELSQFVTQGASNENFIGASNRFFTLVPHSFGTEMPPILDTLEAINEKIQMLDSLMEIELAYNMLNTDTDENKNPIDGHYEQLKAEIQPLDKNSAEFKQLVTYVKNTHAETHNTYDLEVEEIFKVKRSGEDKRYKPFRKLHNRKLLWHGSRLTNYAGILSHGLKIAPPEAPPTGYMFGKGIYFADMVSKSANYCCTNPVNNTGLVLLCEVALGNMQEYNKSHYVTKLPTGKHSTKGVGQTFPDPAESVTREDGVEIPLGKPTKSTDPNFKSDLLYNEYIVYDIAQVNCQYLMRMKFNYKYLNKY